MVWPRHGQDGVASFFAATGTTGPVTEFTPLAFAGNDEGDVMVFIRYAFTVTATGKHVAMNMHHYRKFRDGKVCYVRSSRTRRRSPRPCCPDPGTEAPRARGPDRPQGIGWALTGVRESSLPARGGTLRAWGPGRWRRAH